MTLIKQSTFRVDRNVLLATVLPSSNNILRRSAGPHSALGLGGQGTVMKLKLLAGVLFVCVVIAATVTVGARGQSALTAETVDAEVTVVDGAIVAKFAVKVTNAGEIPVSDVAVAFADDTSAAVGNITAGASAKTASQEKHFTFPEGSSRNFAVPVTLKYVAGGELRESPATIYLPAK